MLTAAGRLRRQLPDLAEPLVVLQAIDSVNRPKLLPPDVGLFDGILSDLFPGATPPRGDTAGMREALEAAAEHHKLQPVCPIPTLSLGLPNPQPIPRPAQSPAYL